MIEKITKPCWNRKIFSLLMILIIGGSSLGFTYLFHGIGVHSAYNKGYDSIELGYTTGYGD